MVLKEQKYIKLPTLNINLLYHLRGENFMNCEVVNLRVNYKTLDEFNKFNEFSYGDISMTEDLRAGFIENTSESPFYGIYFGGTLVARMSLYHIKSQKGQNQEYYYLKELEVLPKYQKKGFGKALVDFAKDFNLPIKTIGKFQSRDFWLKMGFSEIDDEATKEFDENVFIWTPPNMSKDNFLGNKSFDNGNERIYC